MQHYKVSHAESHSVCKPNTYSTLEIVFTNRHSVDWLGSSVYTGKRQYEQIFTVLAVPLSRTFSFGCDGLIKRDMFWLLCRHLLLQTSDLLLDNFMFGTRWMISKSTCPWSIVLFFSSFSSDLALNLWFVQIYIHIIKSDL